MEYAVFGKDKKLAVLTIYSDNTYSIDFDDKKFERFLSSKTGEGLDVFYEEHKDGKNIILYKKIFKDDTGFGYAIIDYLKRSNYVIKQNDPDLDKEINQVLNFLPDSSDKQKITDIFPTLTYLEKTFLLRELKKIS